MPQAKTLNMQELDKVLESVRWNKYPERDRIMILISFWSGMRVGEIASLKISDVLGSDGNIKSEVRLTPEQTKGSRHRKVLLGEKLKEELAVYIKGIGKKPYDYPLIPSQQGIGFFNPNALVQKFKSIYERAGVYGASSHSGRRTFITMLANKGTSVRVLQALAGHRHIGTTQRYIDVNEELMREAIERI